MSQTVPSVIEKNQEDLKKDAKIRELWMKNICDHDKHAKFKIKETYDFIIIGAGTAGCVLARELIHGIPNINILVLEAGGPNVHANGLISLPCTWYQAYQLYDCDWGYVTQEQKMKSHVNPIKEVTVKKGIPYPRGKVWGGCSSLNGMVYMQVSQPYFFVMRGQAKQYNDWAAQGPEYKIWDWDHCLEAFKAIENNTRENPDEKFKKFHGFNGLLHVQDLQNGVYDIMSDLIDAAKNLGIPYNDDFNGERQNGVGRYQTTNEKGKRCSLADGYLRDALKKVEFHPGSEPNGFGKVVAVDVRSYAHVLEIIWDEENKKENIATGVRYFCNGTVREAFIAPKGEVIICSGAINSPQILMLSGVGPKENLEANNIKIRKELPVGKSLLDHPSCFSVAKSTPNTVHHWSSGCEIGIMHKANVEGKIPCKEDFFDENPDIQIIALPLRPYVDGLDGDGIILLSILNVPSSIGYLELNSNNPFDQPRIHLNYFEKSDDLYRMISSLKLCREIFKQPPLSTVYNVKEIGINDNINGDDISDEDWEKFVLEKSITTFHPSGTVKMAPESKGGVVNHRLQVYGTKNLRVIDASIFPYIPTGNTNAPTAMVAWRASRLIIEDYTRKNSL
ncbi:GMC oxidoreductase [Gigaspora rosea]|uniref:GMC oxidoreductase n=1 Tax=Gigaspora rosea TaxID=44941 RepID=A0A397VMC6_9GLOM|nr:GMC oxidoreductase [Gigaspora rosea]